MIITKTPLRVSFFGGGSDLPDYYMHEDRHGLCVSTTINKYIYLAMNRCVADHIRLSYSHYELKTDVEHVNHGIIRETLKLCNILNKIEISSFSDIPHAGSGLGSSSSFTVGLLQGLLRLDDALRYDTNSLAAEAANIEINILNQPIGLQDQYAAAYGGFNAYRFTEDGVVVESINAYPLVKNMLEDRLMFFNTNMTRNASDILGGQVNNLKDGDARKRTDHLVWMAEKSITYLEQGNLDAFGCLLDEGWFVKKNIAPGISNEKIDVMYGAAMAAGALGGKLLGAGGGGYLMMYVPLSKQEAVRYAMRGYYEMKVEFTNEGSKAQVI